jgi:hypothetical protein
MEPIICSRFTLIEAFVSAQTPASINAVLKYLDNSMNTKNKGELIEIFLMASAFAPRPSDLLLEQILVGKSFTFQIHLFIFHLGTFTKIYID